LSRVEVGSAQEARAVYRGERRVVVTGMGMAQGADTSGIQAVKANWEKAMSVIEFDPSWRK
jgi:hypothetical protein